MSLRDLHLPPPALGSVAFSLQERDETRSRNASPSPSLPADARGGAQPLGIVVMPGCPSLLARKCLKIYLGTLVPHQLAHAALTLPLPRG